METRILNTQHVALPNDSCAKARKRRFTHKQFLAIHNDASHWRRMGRPENLFTRSWANAALCVIPNKPNTKQRLRHVQH